MSLPEEQLPAVPPQPTSAELGHVRPELLQYVTEAAAAEWAPGTRRVYDRHWRRFVAWTRRVGIADYCPATPGTVAVYLTALLEEERPRRGRRSSRREPARVGERGLVMQTVKLARASIAWGHRQAGLVTPTADPRIRGLLKGLNRKHGEPARQARPLMPTHLAVAVRWLEQRRERTRFLRDRALLLAGFAGAFRRSELVALRRRDVTVREDGVLFRIHAQQGHRLAEVIEGAKDREAGESAALDFPRDPALVALGICPVQAIREWSEASGGQPDDFFFRALRGEDSRPSARDDEAPLILGRACSSQKVDRLVKVVARAIGFHPDDYGGHSLRAGLATYWIHVREVNRFTVKDYMRHGSLDMLERYVRDWQELPGRGM